MIALLAFLMPTLALATSPPVPIATELKFTLGSVSSASGIVRRGENNFVIADSDASLAEFDAKGHLVANYPVPFRALPTDPKERKKLKPDFESLFFVDAHHWAPAGAIVAWPSFSTKNRTKIAVFPLDGKTGKPTAAQVYDFARLGKKLAKEVKDLNTEGALVKGDDLFVFQRGNGKAAKNGAFRIPLGVPSDATAHGAFKDFCLKFNSPPAVTFTPLALDEIDGVALSFTDATLLEGGLVLALAAAEDTQSTYDDGVVKGSALYVVDLSAKRVRHLGNFSIPKKFEGLAAVRSGEKIRLFLVDDADDPTRLSGLYEASIPSASGLQTSL